MDKYIKICPKCGSTDVEVDYSIAAKIRFGAPLDMRCKSCGFASKVFPEILEQDIEEFRKKLKKK